MGSHHLACQRETDTGALLLCRKKRHEYFSCQIIRNAGPVVRYIDNDIAATVKSAPHLDFWIVCIQRCLPGIAQQIQQHGFQQYLVGVDIQARFFSGGARRVN